MIFEIQKKEFLNHIQKVQSIVEIRSTVPILMNVRIKVENGHMEIIATDMEVGIRDICEVTVESPGSITVSAKKLYEVLKELSEGIVRFEVQDNNWILLTCSSTRMKLVGTSDEDYPRLPEYDEEKLITISAEKLDTLTKKTLYAVSNDENRHILNGVFFQITPTHLRMVATDGHRLAFAETPNVEKLPDMEVVVPKKCIHEVLRMASSGSTEYKFGLMEHHIVFNQDQEIVIARQVEGQFPNYSMVIPPETTFQIKINRQQFYNALRRVSLFSDLQARGVKLTLGDNLMLINASTPEYGEAKDEFPIEYAGEQMIISFNVNYILELLRSFDEEEFTLEINEVSGPVLFRPIVDNDYNYFAVIMPMVI